MRVLRGEAGDLATVPLFASLPYGSQQVYCGIFHAVISCISKYVQLCAGGVRQYFEDCGIGKRSAMPESDCLRQYGGILVYD